MDAAGTARVFGALGHEGRLAIFRLLASAGPEGVPAGEIARRTGQVQNTTSANLSVLSNAGLVSPRREGRSIFYAVSAPRLDAAVRFLTAKVLDDPAGASAPPLGRQAGPGADAADGAAAESDLGHDAA